MLSDTASHYHSDDHITVQPQRTTDKQSAMLWRSPVPSSSLASHDSSRPRLAHAHLPAPSLTEHPSSRPQSSTLPSPQPLSQIACPPYTPYCAELVRRFPYIDERIQHMNEQYEMRGLMQDPIPVVGPTALDGHDNFFQDAAQLNLRGTTAFEPKDSELVQNQYVLITNKPAAPDQLQTLVKGPDLAPFQAADAAVPSKQPHLSTTGGAAPTSLAAPDHSHQSSCLHRRSDMSCVQGGGGVPCLKVLRVIGCAGFYKIGIRHGQLQSLAVSGCAGLGTLRLVTKRLGDLAVEGCGGLEFVELSGTAMTGLSVGEHG